MAFYYGGIQIIMSYVFATGWPTMIYDDAL
jgi:hypothetical protein